MTRRRGLRLMVVVALCLLLGAATTVVVAWLVGRPTRDVDWEIHTTTPDNAPPLNIWQARTTFISWDLTFQYDPRSVFRAGWPWIAVESDHDLVVGGVQPPLGEPWQFLSWRQGIVAPIAWQEIHECLPVRPLWPGFAINTALYSTVWWLLLFAPLPLFRAARRRLRVSRGMCASCAYNLKGSPEGPCPECGHAPSPNP
jgi:hypothetical protein